MQLRFMGFTPSKWLYPECDGLYTQFDAATDYRTVMPQFRNYDANAQLLALIRRFAEEKDASPAQISLAWMLRTMPLMFNSPMRSLLR
jgi:aryl-alcohol dehydrogenase-like predicted oxidoreductase